MYPGSENLSCEQCGEKFTQPTGAHVPKIISCLHTWCSSCLQVRLVQSESLNRVAL
jgi:ribosomal protein S27E